jgi:plastocyanin
MKSRAVVAGVVLAITAVLAAAGSLSASASAAAAAATRSPARMLVYAQEWSLWPSRGSLPPGSVTVQLWNRGEDAHNLRIRRLGRSGLMVGRAQAVAVTQSGKLSEATWRLGPGRYELYCSMPGHLKRGMHAWLRVR